VLQREANLTLETGLRLLIHSDVPVGKGVSSSASLEVATMQALCGMLNIALDGRKLALLCQKAENLVVGAPCGVMDQMTAACGRQQQLMALLCQPAELMPPVHVPANVSVWGIDSGLRHAVTGADYGDVRTGAFMGYRMLADVAGLPVSVSSSGTVAIKDTRWHGYLANVTPREWESELCNAIPADIDGAVFLERYGATTDSVTRVDPARRYAVRQPTAHPIYEHVRVQHFRELLEHDTVGDSQLQALGDLMYQSHASYNACGLGSSGTDRLVELVQEAGSAAGLYGAKITGGGSGGTVAILGRPDAGAIVHGIAEQYRAETGRDATVLEGSSLGAVQFGLLELQAQ
jgi:L-arabinokinase